MTPPMKSDHPPPLPDRVCFEIGGFFAACHRIVSAGGKVKYQSAKYGDPVLLHPSQSQWEQFWEAVDEAGVWTWSHEYWDHGICDGTQWKLKLTHHGKSVRCFGSNAFPGSAAADYSEDSNFGRFVVALRQLTGLREIE